MDMPLALIPLCSVELDIARAHHIGNGPSGDRWIAEVTGMTLTGERLNASLVGSAAADWVTVVGGVGTIDVRATVETHDGALVFVQYRGRTDATRRIGTSPAYVTPVFESGDERYTWLNALQAVGKSRISDLKNAHYDWYELR